MLFRSLAARLIQNPDALMLEDAVEGSDLSALTAFVKGETTSARARRFRNSERQPHYTPRGNSICPVNILQQENDSMHFYFL